MPVTNLQLLNQVHFSGEAQCEGFRPNPLRPNFCTECNKLFDKHRADLIPDDECLLQALAYSQKAEIIPSTILPLNDKEGGLFLGGFRSVMNAEFLKDLKVKYIVNTAKGLEIFGPKYLESVKKAKDELKVTILDLNWEDHNHFIIPDNDVITSCRFIHEAIKSGNSVLVHCAQGKSRSSTAVIAYLMATRNMKSQEALQFVQSNRKMAQPNPRFMQRLQEFEKSSILTKIRAELQ